MTSGDQTQETFKKLKSTCVPLLGASLLTPASVPDVSKLLNHLIATLKEVQASEYTLTPSLISYIFFPLSTILRRNAPSAISDQILEKILIVLGILWESWWWDCDMEVWDQTFMLCGAVIGGIEGKGKGKDRDDETKEAAAQCLLSLLKERVVLPDEGSLHESRNSEAARVLLAGLQSHVEMTEFIPILGQTLNSLLVTAESRHLPLQRLSLLLLGLLIPLYVPEWFITSILPGVVSSMSKVALGVSEGKGWANSGIVALALQVMQEAITKALGDDICTKEGAVRSVTDIQDFAGIVDETDANHQSGKTRPYSTPRTSSWLRGTSSQLHIAMNALTPLVSHPTPTALLALSEFSTRVLASTSLTLSQSQALLLSFLLSLSNSIYTSVATEARVGMLHLLAYSSKVHYPLMQTLMHTTRDNLAALPRIIPSYADAKVEHIAGLIEAVGRLTVSLDGEAAPNPGLSSISTEIGKLLGPTGGIEKWGWSLLSVLEFTEPQITISRTFVAPLVLENDPSSPQWVHFPELTMKFVSIRTAHDALIRMFHSLGRAGGDGCLFAIEWFANVGRNGKSARSVAALWCACRLLEGVGNITLDSGSSDHSMKQQISKRLSKLARGLTMNITEVWDEMENDDFHDAPQEQENDDDAQLPVELVKNNISIRVTIDAKGFRPEISRKPALQPMVHKSLSLQLLAVAAGVLQARFTPLLLHTFYPVLHSLVSPVPHLSSTALATLNFITISTSYASPANLLLSNFDYALDAVSRRLTRRWLDVDATKVLVVLIRLVGNDVVEKASDVVEECFDRLDDYHGYGIVVEGLIEVLGEVIKVIEVETEASPHTKDKMPTETSQPKDNQRLDIFLEWFSRRSATTVEGDPTDYHTAPQDAWGEGRDKKTEEGKEGGDENLVPDNDPFTDPPPTPPQALTKQIVSRSLYFLTHGYPAIRARILTLLSSSVPVLPESALLPSIHHAWPFILNRLADPEPFVVSAAASLIEALATHVGGFMFRRIWDDVWPRFRTMLSKLDTADSTNALARRGFGAVGTESAYTHSHRLYRSLLRTMTATAKDVPPQDSSMWEVVLAFRRFLHSQAHEELQACARDLYLAIAMNNEDAVWLALSSTAGDNTIKMSFLKETKWDIKKNVALIWSKLGTD